MVCIRVSGAVTWSGTLSKASRRSQKWRGSGGCHEAGVYWLGRRVAAGAGRGGGVRGGPYLA